MKPLYRIASLAVGCLACTQVANAEMIGLQNWADEVVGYTSNIENQGERINMDATTEWWVLGPSDADVNHDGYGLEEGVDHNYVAGWCATAPGEFIVVKFDAALRDVEGNDLVIHMYCGPDAEGSVSASADNTSYTQIGSIVGAPGEVPGNPGWFYDAEFDFHSFGLDNVHYIKVQRVANGPQTGMFFDSFASTPVPEPTALGLLVLGSVVIAGGWLVTRRRTR